MSKMSRETTVDEDLDFIGEKVLTEEEYDHFLIAELTIIATILRWDYNDTTNEKLRRNTVERIQKKAREYNKNTIDTIVYDTIKKNNIEDILLLHMSLRLARIKRNDDKHFDDLDYGIAIDKLEKIINKDQIKSRQEKEDAVLNALEAYKNIKIVTEEIITRYKDVVENYSMKRRFGVLVDDLTIASSNKKINETFSNYLNYMLEELNRDSFKIKITDLIIENENSDNVSNMIIIEKQRFIQPPPSNPNDTVFKNFADDPVKNQKDYISLLDDIYDKYQIILKFWIIFNKYNNIEFVDDDKDRQMVYKIYNTYVNIIEFYRTLKPTQKSEDKIKIMTTELNNINRSLLILSTDSSLKLYKLFKNSCGIVNDEMKDLIILLKQNEQNALFEEVLLAYFKKENDKLKNINIEIFNNFKNFNIDEIFKIFFIIYYIDLRSNFLKEFTFYLSEIFSIFTDMALHIDDPEKWDNKVVYIEKQLLKYLNDNDLGQLIILGKRPMYNKIWKENKQIKYVLERLKLILNERFSLNLNIDIDKYLILNNAYLTEYKETLRETFTRHLSRIPIPKIPIPKIPIPKMMKISHKGRVVPEPEFSNIVSQYPQQTKAQPSSMFKSNRVVDLTQPPQTSKIIHDMFTYSLNDIPHFYNIINYIFSEIMNIIYNLIESKAINQINKNIDNREKYYRCRDIIKEKLKDLRNKYIVLYEILSKYKEHSGGRVNKSNKNNVKKPTDPKKKPTTDPKKPAKKPTDPTKKPTKLNRGADMNMKDIRGLCKANQIKLSTTKDGVRIIYKKKELITKLKRKKIL